MASLGRKHVGGAARKGQCVGDVSSQSGFEVSLSAVVGTGHRWVMGHGRTQEPTGVQMGSECQ